MRTDIPAVTRLAEYRPPDHLCDRIEIDIGLHATATTVDTTLHLRPNPAGESGAPLFLHGDELVFKGAELDGERLSAEAFSVAPDGFSLPRPPPRSFALRIRTEVDPTANTKLMGLYRSGGVYCTQCEADGFRRIAYSLDRPDVLSVYTTRIEADADEAPILLGNGDPVESGPAPQAGRHYAVWYDPHPKPTYLFAIVGGRLGRIGTTITTAGGRAVDLAVWVEPGKEPRAAYALDALERALRWDERVFGREYDLSVFNVVAVPDFNMGAMENKGLNIFNDKYVLASPETATDSDYANIETVIAHEYFHNWTGNRITCRDWFQLCLKEGLTVFRDQEFSSDQRSRAVQRIHQVRTLRARQFAEDAGPLAHPVRPSQYREINNFYTATVYEKGAEVVRMLRTLLGEPIFAAGMAQFFESCDGTAATVEDFLAAFAAVSGRDLGAFARWYDQAGTPVVTVKASWDEAASEYRLDFAQETPPTPGQPEKTSMVLPVALGLVPEEGAPLALDDPRIRPDGVFVLDVPAATLVVNGVNRPVVPSVFRGFSAPVRLKLDLADRDLLVLLRRDSDPFNRWQAGQTVALRTLLRRYDGGEEAIGGGARFAEALDAFVQAEADRDPAFAAVMLTLPGEAEIAQEIGSAVDPDRVRLAWEGLRAELGSVLAPVLRELRVTLDGAEPYSPDALAAGRRALRNVALDLLSAGSPRLGEVEAQRQFETSGNMTDRLAGLSVLARIPGPIREAAFAAFEAEYRDDPLVLDKWFGLQAAIPEPETLDRVRRLTAHPAFAWSNPNRVRAAVGSFALSNPTQFHRPDGQGYSYLAEVVLGLNAANPQVAARLLTAFSTWRMMEAGRAALAEAALERIAAAPGLSPDVLDIVTRSLARPDRT